MVGLLCYIAGIRGLIFLLQSGKRMLGDILLRPDELASVHIRVIMMTCAIMFLLLRHIFQLM